MENSLTPREIQARIRAGASIEDLLDESGMAQERLAAFAGPVIAEREHVALAARAATVRRRGEAGSHRRLGDLIDARLRSRGIDADDVVWDAWRQGDLRWRITAQLSSDVEAEAREAEFVYDARGRFSTALNADARWMIGEEPRDAAPEDENTVDFHDELALVRATQADDQPGDDVPASDLMHDGNDDTSELDSLYDMLSGISEDSVRIYTGLIDPAGAEPDEDEETVVVDDSLDEPAPEPTEEPAPEPEPEPDPEPVQEALVKAEAEEPKPKRRRRRAKVPSWDEIMFGGPTK